MVRLLALLLLLPLPALADSLNVAKSAELLDYDIPNAPLAPEAGLGALDIDGDGEVSRAEAAGNAEVSVGFERADRNRDGQLTSAEWRRYERWQAQRAKARESASAGGTARRSGKKDRK